MYPRVLFFLLFTVLLTTFSSLGQKMVTKNYTLMKNIRVNDEFFHFQVEEYDEKEKKFYSKEKFYYWYKSQEIKLTQGGSGGRLLDGVYEHFYANKQLAEKGYFKKGLKHGTWTYWNKEGYILRVERWRNGYPRGRTMIYDGKGNNVKVVNIRLNKITYATDSLFVIATPDSSKVKTFQLVSENNVSIYKYCNGKLHGKQLIFRDSLQEAPIIHRYKNGVLHGKQVDADGTVSKYKHGELIPTKEKDTTARKGLFNFRDKKEEEGTNKEQTSADKPKKQAKEKEEQERKGIFNFLKNRKTTKEED